MTFISPFIASFIGVAILTTTAWLFSGLSFATLVEREWEYIVLAVIVMGSLLIIQ